MTQTTYYNPLNVYKTSMRPNILLMCKLFFILLLAHGFLYKISDPFLPFFSFFDHLNLPSNFFKNCLIFIFIGSGALLLSNVKVRLMSGILGLVIILTIVVSKPVFRNHIFFSGCAFLLASLTHKKDTPWLLYIQFSLVYFGAVINKVLQLDWWNGQFMYNLMANARQNQVFIEASSFLPEFWLAKIMSWSSIFTEFFIGLFILFKKRRKLAVWMTIIFHTLLYSLTAFRFGHFYEDILIILLIFLNWPTSIIKVKVLSFNSNLLKKIIKFLYSRGKFSFSFFLSNSIWLKVEIDEKKYVSFNALGMLLLYSPGFYFTLFFIDLGIRFLFNGFIMHLLYMLLYWFIILFFMFALLIVNKKESY